MIFAIQGKVQQLVAQCKTLQDLLAAHVTAPYDARVSQGAWWRLVVRGRGGRPSWDQTKPWGPGQQAPLTAEYQKVLEASLADQANGGQGNFAAQALCPPAGMPFMMVATRPLEFIV